MSLTLKAISYKGLPPQQEISVRFDEQGGSIGRSPDNHLVLPDPDKFVSRLHAHIVFRDGQYFLQDSSTAGTYLLLKDMLLQQNQVALEHGETLRIGEYELAVSIADIVSPGLSAMEPVVRQLEMTDSALLDGPFAPANPPSQPAEFYSSFVEQSDSSVFHQSFTPPELAATPQNTGDDLDFGDLLSTLDALPGASSVSGQQFPPLPDDFFAEPEPCPIDSPVVPQSDMGAEDLFDAGPIQAPLSDENLVTETSVGIEKQGAPLGLDSDSARPVSPLTTADGIFESTTPPRPMPAPAAEAFAGPTLQSAQPEPSSAQPAASPADSELLRLFLEGAGIHDAQFLPPEQWPALMRTSGELLRSLMEGLMLVLRARAELKSQFRVSVTTMRPLNNNPLKFTPNVDDAIKLMLAPTHPGFLQPKEAVREGFSDIMNHQMAMTAGIQAALAEIMRSFDPELIEKSQGEGGLFQKKAKYWEHYAVSYPQLKAAALEDFFGDAFADAYEKQMRLLSQSSKPQ